MEESNKASATCMQGCLHVCQQLDASPINQKRTSEEFSFQDLAHQFMFGTPQALTDEQTGAWAGVGARDGASLVT